MNARLWCIPRPGEGVLPVMHTADCDISQRGSFLVKVIHLLPSRVDCNQPVWRAFDFK